VFNNKIVSSSCMISFKLISFLEHWMVASLKSVRVILESMAEDIRAKMTERVVAVGVG
jgi:hypothetical protein